MSQRPEDICTFRAIMKTTHAIRYSGRCKKKEREKSSRYCRDCGKLKGLLCKFYNVKLLSRRGVNVVTPAYCTQAFLEANTVCIKRQFSATRIY